MHDRLPRPAGTVRLAYRAVIPGRAKREPGMTEGPAPFGGASGCTISLAALEGRERSGQLTDSRHGFAFVAARSAAP